MIDQKYRKFVYSFFIAFPAVFIVVPFANVLTNRCIRNGEKNK